MLAIALASEDALSEAVGIRLIREVPVLEPGILMRRGGFGYLRSRMRAFCQMAAVCPVLVLTDLDRHPCPVALREEWLGRLRQPPGLLLRVAVREVESWLLADHAAMAGLLGPYGARRLPEEPDRVDDPKTMLLTLAQRAPRDVRTDLCAGPGVVARQGLGYNARLSDLVATGWDPERAAVRSESLRRARVRLLGLA